MSPLVNGDIFIPHIPTQNVANNSDRLNGDISFLSVYKVNDEIRNYDNTPDRLARVREVCAFNSDWTDSTVHRPSVDILTARLSRFSLNPKQIILSKILIKKCYRKSDGLGFHKLKGSLTVTAWNVTTAWPDPPQRPRCDRVWNWIFSLCAALDRYVEQSSFVTFFSLFSSWSWVPFCCLYVLSYLKRLRVY